MLMTLMLCYSWRSIIDHLLTHEKTMFKDLMSEYMCIFVLFLNSLNVTMDGCLLYYQCFSCIVLVCVLQICRAVL